MAGSRSVSSSTRRPAASVRSSSRAAVASGWTASKDASASRPSVAISTRSSCPSACAATASASTPATVSAADHEAEAVGGAVGDGRPAREPHQRPVGLAQPLQLLLLAAVDGELGRGLEELDEVGRELAAHGRLAPCRASAEGAGERRHREAADQEPDREHERGGGQERPGRAHGDGAGRDGDERRPEPAQVQVLQGVDVADDTRQQVAAAVGAELRGGQRLDAPVGPDAHRARARGRRGRAT